MVSFVNAPYHAGQKKLGVDRSGATILEKIDDIIGDCLVIHADPLMHDKYQDIGLLHKPEAVAEGCQRVFEKCFTAASTNDNKKMILNLGGDHSIAIGTIGGIFSAHASNSKQNSDDLLYNEPVVIWFDAHADINSLKTTVSGNIHGCPVAFLMNHPDTKGLEAFDWFYQKNSEYQRATGNSGFIVPSRLAYIGLRDVEDGEKEIMKKAGVGNAWFMEDFKATGRDMEKVIASILASVDSEGKRPIHLSLDVDGIDPLYTPSTGTPVPDGVSLDEALQMIDLLKGTGRLLSADIVEVNLFLGTSEDSAKTLESTLTLVKRFMS